MLITQAHVGLWVISDRYPDLFWQSDRGYITSTPKSDDFLKKQRKSPKYERDSCIPRPKNGERPYLASPETPFLDPKIRGFWLFFWPPDATIMR